MFKFVTGDLLKSNAYALVNTVNCEGYMGKGIAYQFKLQFPEMNKDYVSKCKKTSLSQENYIVTIPEANLLSISRQKTNGGKNQKWSILLLVWMN